MNYLKESRRLQWIASNMAVVSVQFPWSAFKCKGSWLNQISVSAWHILHFHNSLYFVSSFNNLLNWTANCFSPLRHNARLPGYTKAWFFLHHSKKLSRCIYSWQDETTNRKHSVNLHGHITTFIIMRELWRTSCRSVWTVWLQSNPCVRSLEAIYTGYFLWNTLWIDGKAGWREKRSEYMFARYC